MNAAGRRQRKQPASFDDFQEFPSDSEAQQAHAQRRQPGSRAARQAGSPAARAQPLPAAVAAAAAQDSSEGVSDADNSDQDYTESGSEEGSEQEDEEADCYGQDSPAAAGHDGLELCRWAWAACQAMACHV